MKKYTSPLTKDLTPENWKEKLDLDNLSLGGYLKEIIKIKMPDDEYDSINWHLERNERTRAGGLNKELIEEEMGEDWVAEHTKEPTEYTELRMTRLETE
jgi:hypothetical protein